MNFLVDGCSKFTLVKTFYVHCINSFHSWLYTSSSYFVHIFMKRPTTSVYFLETKNFNENCLYTLTFLITYGMEPNMYYLFAHLHCCAFFFFFARRSIWIWKIDIQSDYTRDDDTSFGFGYSINNCTIKYLSSKTSTITYA